MDEQNAVNKTTLSQRRAKQKLAKKEERHVRVKQLLVKLNVPSDLWHAALVAWPRGVRSQLQWLLDWQGKLRADSSRKASKKTVDDRKSTFTLFFSDLHARGYKIFNVLNLNSKHIEVLHLHWTAQGLAAATITARRSHLRFFCKLIDKNGMVPSQEALAAKLADYKVVKRITVAQNDKSWDQANVNMVAVIESAFEISPIFGHEISIMYEYGLRLRECVMLEPHRQDMEKELMVDRGGKNGLKRFVPIETLEQRAALSAAKAFVSRGDSLSGKDCGTLKQVYQQVHRWLSLLQKKHPELVGLTIHGLRHGAFHAALRRHGLPVPIAGDRMDQRLTREQEKLLAKIMLAFGHSRISVATAYGGSFSPKKPSDDEK